jgi:cobalt/nickel transport system permease protein
MHMANELLSLPVAGGSLAIAAAGVGFVCRKARRIITSDKLALMGILGAFVFAAQMVNFPLPAMPGTSGHLVGSVLLAVVLGPHLAALAICSVLIVQCLIFQDGGLLALGCNIINMGLVPCYLGYYLYQPIARSYRSRTGTYIASLIACIFAAQAGAILVCLQTALSGVLVVPPATFLVTMSGVHLIIGAMEGLITAAVLGYLQHVRPDIGADLPAGNAKFSKRALYATLAGFTVITAAGLSLLASELPDGLEWSYLHRPEEPGFESLIRNESPVVAAVDTFQAKYSAMPDYTLRSAASTQAAWTSFAGVAGSAATMALIWLTARLIRGRQQTG